jgi:predicted aspartyl protease
MPKTQHFTFSCNYRKLVDRVTSEVMLFMPETGGRISVNALWDTGASLSAISTQIADKLRITPVETRPLSTANGEVESAVALISLELPNGGIIRDSRAAICNLNDGTDMIIGMNIINLGDFTVSSANNETFFSFTMPPFP